VRPAWKAYDLYLRLFYRTKAARKHCEEVWSFSSARSKKIRDSRAPGPAIAKSWLWLADAYVEPLEAYSKVREAAVNADQHRR